MAGPADVRVVLVAPRNPLNIGAAARAMSNFGVSQLRLVNAYDLAFREARSAVGAAPLLAAACEYPDVAESTADCTLVVGTTSVGHRELEHPLYRLEEAAGLIRAHAGPVALLFGSEKFGLSNEDMAHCHWLLRIPTVSLDLSMNLGQAVAVCLYELAREGGYRSASAPRRLASAEENEQVTRLLLEVLRRSGYVNPVIAGSTENKIRRMQRRLSLTVMDARIWLGALRQILWKITRP
ncbi:MAG: TrmH family RNA methyltransferase [Bryobacteraceae bacterium]